MRRRSLIVIIASLIGVCLLFTGVPSAHNIDLKKAREVARDYARRVRDESGGKYVHYSTNCVRAFPGHNHIVSCVISYQNEQDTAKGVYTCRESIEIKMPPHSRSTGSMDFGLHGFHTSWNMCGSRRLNDTLMG